MNNDLIKEFKEVRNEGIRDLTIYIGIFIIGVLAIVTSALFDKIWLTIIGTLISYFGIKRSVIIGIDLYMFNMMCKELINIIKEEESKTYDKECK